MIACRDEDLDNAFVYMVFYATTMQNFLSPEISLRNLAVSHRFVTAIVALNIEQVFNHMQGEIWSPHGEGMDIIKGAGLNHTSMMTGDVIYSTESNTYWVCQDMGWALL